MLVNLEGYIFNSVPLIHVLDANQEDHSVIPFIMKTNSITFYALSKGKLKNSHARIVQLYVYVGVRT